MTAIAVGRRRHSRALIIPEVDRSALHQCQWLRKHSTKPRRRRRAYVRIKRGVDLIAILAAAPVLILLAAACALALKIEDPSAPVIFGQLRTGYRGERFRIYKFRSMVKNAEELKATLAHLNERTWPDFKIEDDPRITRVGKILRKLSLDEIPQFWNVIVGQMTLVGPRPTSLAPDKYQHWQMERFDVRPGITGLWQVGGRESTSFVERLRLDISYVERCSLLLDLEIIVRTLPAVALGRGSC